MACANLTVPRKGLGFSTLMAASAVMSAFMFVMGAPSTRIWPPEMSSSGSLMCGDCLRTSEMSKRRGRRFFFGNSWAPSGLDRTRDQAKKEVLGPCRRSWGRSAYRLSGARQQGRQAPAGPY